MLCSKLPGPVILFPHRQFSSPPFFRRAARPHRNHPSSLLPAVIVACLLVGGCSRLKHKQETETVYVLSKQTFLRDRVAAVSNRVGVVQNGQKLELLERGRRFLRVKTEKGEIGWIEEHAVVNPEVVTGFETLKTVHGRDPVIATATLRDDGYLHLKPGRDTDRYYLLPEGDKLQLLLRASVPKVIGPQAAGSSSSFARRPPRGPEKGTAARSAKVGREKAEEKKPAVVFTPAPPAGAPLTPVEAAPTAAPPVPVPMEDWWMVRDTEGKVGWLMSRRIDVDVPDEISGYAEGQRVVAAYLLRKVDDPESNFPDKRAPEYVTVLNPYVDGLPYDFSQVRVFTWNLRKHRYETAFRQRNLQGYLPVLVTGQGPDQSGPTPVFSFKQGIGDSVTIDPDTGAARPTSAETLTYRLEGSLVRKYDPNAPPPAPRVAAPKPPGPTRKAPANRRRHAAGSNRRHHR